MIDIELEEVYSKGWQKGFDNGKEMTVCKALRAYCECCSAYDKNAVCECRQKMFFKKRLEEIA